MTIPQSGLRIDSPAFPLLQADVSFWGVTTAAGNALGTTLVCAGLATRASLDGLPVKIISGPAAGQVKTIYVHAGNTLTVATPFTNAAGAVQQITAGVLFVVRSASGGGGGPVPAPEEGLTYYGIVDAVPGANQFTVGSLAGLGAGKFDGVTNPYWVFVLRDVGGAGAAPQGELQQVTAYVTATGTFTTNAFTAALAIGDEILIVHPSVAAAIIAAWINQGLVYYGVVTAVPGANQFTIPTLALMGAGKFVDANAPWQALVFRDAGGASAAPQGEMQEITAYATATGTFTTNAFTAAVAIGDEILILNPVIAAIGRRTDVADYTAGATQSTLMSLLKGLLGVRVIAEGTLDTSSATVPADSTRAEGNDFFKGCVLMPIAGGIAFQPRPIRQFTAVTGVFTLDEPFTAAPGLVAYVILASDYPVQRLIDIFNLVNAMLFTTETGGTITTDGTEQNAYINNAPAGVYEPLKVMLDFTNMTAAETIVVRVYYRIRPGGNLIKKDQLTFVGAQDPDLKNIELEPNRYGIRISIECSAGGPIDVDWEVLYRV